MWEIRQGHVLREKILTHEYCMLNKDEDFPE
jgi:hypothetical protein